MSALALSSGSSSFDGGSFGMIHLPSPTFCLPFSLAGCGALGRIAVLTPFQRKFIYI